MRYKYLIPMLLAVGITACTPAYKSASGFRLPDGNAEHGRALFVKLECYTCHLVADDTRFPGEPKALPKPVVLGGLLPFEHTDGELVTEVINPTYHLAHGYAKEGVSVAGTSRMVDYTEVLTIHQLADLIAYLHSIYKVEYPPAANY